MEQEEQRTTAQLERAVSARRHALTPADLEEIFTYHPPTAEQQRCYEVIRADAKAFASTVLENTPPCADQTAAIRLIRHAVMTANAAIALKGLV